MSMTFPASPTHGDLHTTGGKVWRYSTDRWVIHENIRLPGSVVQRTAQQTVTNTVTETDILNYAVPGNSLGADGILEFHITGQHEVQNTVADGRFRLEVHVGATKVYEDNNHTSMSQNAAAYGFDFNMKLMANGTNAQVLGGNLMVNTAGGATVGIGNLGSDEPLGSTAIRGTSAEDSTAALTIRVTITHMTADAGMITTIDPYVIKQY